MTLPSYEAQASLTPGKSQATVPSGNGAAFSFLKSAIFFFKFPLNKLLNNQSNIEDIDTVSGATISSTALKKMFINVLNDMEA